MKMNTKYPYDQLQNVGDFVLHRTTTPLPSVREALRAHCKKHGGKITASVVLLQYEPLNVAYEDRTEHGTLYRLERVA